MLSQSFFRYFDLELTRSKKNIVNAYKAIQVKLILWFSEKLLTYIIACIVYEPWSKDFLIGGVFFLWAFAQKPAEKTQKKDTPIKKVFTVESQTGTYFGGEMRRVN